MEELVEMILASSDCGWGQQGCQAAGRCRGILQQHASGRHSAAACIRASLSYFWENPSSNGVCLTYQSNDRYVGF